MVANSSRKANLEMFLIVIGGRGFYCIAKKMNVGEKQDKRKGSRFSSRKEAELVVCGTLNPTLLCSVFCCRAECECGK